MLFLWLENILVIGCWVFLAFLSSPSACLIIIKTWVSPVTVLEWAQWSRHLFQENFSPSVEMPHYSYLTDKDKIPLIVDVVENLSCQSVAQTQKNILTQGVIANIPDTCPALCSPCLFFFCQLILGSLALVRLDITVDNMTWRGRWKPVALVY